MVSDKANVSCNVDSCINDKFFMQHFGCRYAVDNFYPPRSNPPTARIPGTKIVPHSQVEWAAHFERASPVKTSIFMVVRSAINNVLASIKNEDGTFKACSCKPAGPAAGLTCTDDTNCLLRKHQVECSPSSTCHQNSCQNKRAQEDKFLTSVYLASTTAHGICLESTEDIPAGALVVEYLGVVTRGKVKRNQHFAYPIEKYNGKNGEKHICCEQYGNESRFLSHDANNPNCEIQEWIVDNRLRLLVYAIRHIPRGEVLTVKFPHFHPNPHPDYKCITESELTRIESKRRTAKKFYRLISLVDSSRGCATQSVSVASQSESGQNGTSIKLNMACSNSSVSDDNEAPLKSKQCKNSNGETVCNYGFCRRPFPSLQQLEEHKANDHHAVLPECSFSRRDLFCSSRPAPTFGEFDSRVARKSMERRCKFGDLITDDVLLYDPSLERLGIDPESAAERIRLLADLDKCMDLVRREYYDEFEADIIQQNQKRSLLVTPAQFRELHNVKLDESASTENKQEEPSSSSLNTSQESDSMYQEHPSVLIAAKNSSGVLDGFDNEQQNNSDYDSD